jgi:DNA topoisomerase-1
MAKAAPKRTRKPGRPASGDGSRAAGKSLVVVESPAKARTIGHYLGPGYIVRASMGHVRDLPPKQLGVDLEHDFNPTYEPLAGRRKVLAELQKYARNADTVFLATDLDREGEAIAWHLAQSLGADPSRVRRVTFNEITATAIREAFAHPRDIDLDKVNAQQARRILDRIVGYQLSPLLWRKVATGLSAGRVQSVAVMLIVKREREIQAFNPREYWRIEAVFTTDLAKAPGLASDLAALLAQRDELGNPPPQARRQEFLNDRQCFGAELLSWRGKRFDADAADATLEVAKALGLAIDRIDAQNVAGAKPPADVRKTVVGRLAAAPVFRVASVNERDSRARPPAPFTTATLQQTAAVQLRFPTSRTMRVAQDLYEGVEVPGEGSVGLITYMRTDSTHLSGEAVSAARTFISEQFGQSYLPDKPNVYSASARAQQAHEAVRPTDVRRRPDQLTGVLGDEQHRLYSLIWKRFVACQMAPALWKVAEADIVADTPAGQAVFRAMGRRLVFDGFFRVAGQPRGADQTLPALAAQQVVAPLDLEPTQHFTQAPPRYTEASLVKALEAEGIGRPSTYASIIQTIQDRQYVRQDSRSFFPTDLGTVVTDKLTQHFPRLLDERFTAHMEDQLDKVEDAQMNWVRLLEEFYRPFKADLERAAAEMVHAKAQTQPSDYACQACGKPMVYRFSRNGRYLACSGYPDCKQTCPVDDQGQKVQRVEVDQPCPLCGKSPMVLRRSRFGAFLGCSDYPNCKGLVPCDKEGRPLRTVKAEDVHEKCPVCGRDMAVKMKGRRPFLGCAGYPDCKATAPIPDGLRIEQPPRKPAKESGVLCPKCGRAMVIRESRRGEFLACSGFPRCRNAFDLSKLDELKAEQAKNPVKPYAAPAKKAAKKSARKSAKKTSGASGGSPAPDTGAAPDE